MFAVLMIGKYSSLSTCIISGERFASLLSCCSPLFLRWHPRDTHRMAVQEKVAQLSVFKHGLLSWGRETEARFQRAVLPGSVALRAERHWEASQPLTYRCHVFPFSLKRIVFRVYSAKITCEIQSTNQYWILKRIKWNSKLLIRE